MPPSSFGGASPPQGAGISLLLQGQGTGAARESCNDCVSLSHAGVHPGEGKWCPPPPAVATFLASSRPLSSLGICLPERGCASSLPHIL